MTTSPCRSVSWRRIVTQVRREEKHLKDPGCRLRVHVTIVTARNAPAHERAVMRRRCPGPGFGCGSLVGDRARGGGLRQGRASAHGGGSSDPRSMMGQDAAGPVGRPVRDAVTGFCGLLTNVVREHRRNTWLNC
ncbi:hypothetical protein GCM10018781_77950 [Kitasatospora indigofera]|uniref:Uncharacterized protein n=1 Tax=Kitasatospora indigofera TaxID=67307 RepID=A0A918YVX9_9ACTN|nr:hypothetical protein GCM10018781_77950 [Kitasatospora indigofera]